MPVGLVRAEDVLEKSCDYQKVDDGEIVAKYKIQVQFGKDRSISALKPCVAGISIWESGKKLHGGGDQQMAWCGYDDCDNPITADLFGYFHVVCPKCRRENFLDDMSKIDHIKETRKEGKNVGSLKKIPIVANLRMFRLTPKALALVLEKWFFRLESNADIYLKYHPSDIRYQVLGGDLNALKTLEKARAGRGFVIYPLKNILKDTSAGAEPWKRFMAMITA